MTFAFGIFLIAACGYFIAAVTPSMGNGPREAMRNVACLLALIFSIIVAATTPPAVLAPHMGPLAKSVVGLTISLIVFALGIYAGKAVRAVRQMEILEIFVNAFFGFFTLILIGILAGIGGIFGPFFVVMLFYLFHDGMLALLLGALATGILFHSFYVIACIYGKITVPPLSRFIGGSIVYALSVPLGISAAVCVFDGNLMMEVIATIILCGGLPMLGLSILSDYFNAFDLPDTKKQN